MNFQMFKLHLEKAEEPEIKLPSVFWNIEKAREFQKNIYFALLTTPKPLCGSQQTVENSERDGNLSDHHTRLLRNVYAGQEATVRSRHGTTDWY